MKLWISALLALALISNQSAFAYESEDSYGYQPSSDESSITENLEIKKNDATRIQKFEAALDTLGIPHEPAPDFSNFVHANEANQAEVQKNLQWIDPDKGLARYLSIVKGNFQLFRDFFKSMISLDLQEYQQNLSTYNRSNDSLYLIAKIKAIASRTQANASYPLSGLKVLIDPGHMGGDEWDHKTGKFVEVDGKKVSEGDLNLWTSLLVAKKLEKLGATVKLTRNSAKPVSPENDETFDATPFIHNYFYSSMDDWMAPYLTKSIDEVKATIKDAANVAKAYSPAQKLQFFISGLDLEARSKIIDQFNPDITLDIHFDASDSTKLQNTRQSLEAFVPGAFLQNETGSRKAKAMAVKHLLEVRRWNQSVRLAGYITRSMSTALNIPRLDVEKAYFSPPAYAKRVVTGVYARNLYITRRAFSSLVVYLECLHYDHVSEFSKLATLDKSGSYQNVTFQYPNRLDTISDSIQNGVLNYFYNTNL